MADTISPSLLCRIAEQLYGPLGWHQRLAEDLGVNLRTVQRWANGQNTIPPTLRPELQDLMKGRGEDLRTLITELNGGGS